MRKNVSMERLFVIAVLFTGTGCYTYVPANGTIPDMGREVRVRLAPSQSIDMGRLTVQDVTQVDGTVYRSTADTVAIWSQWFHTGRRERFYANGHIHVLRSEQAADLEVRKLHVARTAVATAAVIAAGTAVFAFTADLGGGGITEPGDGDTQGSLIGVIPIFRIPIP